MVESDKRFNPSGSELDALSDDELEGYCAFWSRRLENCADTRDTAGAEQANALLNAGILVAHRRAGLPVADKSTHEARRFAAHMASYERAATAQELSRDASALRWEEAQIRRLQFQTALRARFMLEERHRVAVEEHYKHQIADAIELGSSACLWCRRSLQSARAYPVHLRRGVKGWVCGPRCPNRSQATPPRMPELDPLPPSTPSNSAGHWAPTASDDDFQDELWYDWDDPRGDGWYEWFSIEERENWYGELPYSATIDL